MKHTNQQGITVLGGLVSLAIVGFFLTAALKIGPLYLDNSFVKAAIDSLEEDNIHNMSDAEVRRKLLTHFDINNVRDIDTKLIRIKREQTHTEVSLNYEKRVNFMGNLDVVVRFENTYDSAR